MTYNASILKATNVVNWAMIESLPDALWSYNTSSGKISYSFDSNTVRVIFNLPGTTGISGSGSLATIHFTVTGTVGNTSVLDISDELLVDIWADEILSTWIDDGVSV